ncbi:hypothetical protein [Spiroplasma ixodetis]|uniref:Uncharacterized protein n=1 Tax=Spiroplasma ixodetis TaxID=2141 RepID=A0ABM8BZD9_9MOLU|nr:hypothetical protein [Spiroplasma ixodetis]BDT05180.1 hypothetical protein SHM_28260 [Spiroplasma ixodetis]
MLKNKHLWLGLSLTLATTNIVANTSITNNLTSINKLKQENKNKTETNEVVTNTTYGNLSNSTILNSQDENGIYHLFDVKSIIDNPSLEPYVKDIYIENFKLTYNPEKINKDVINEFDKEIAAINYKEEQLTSTNDLQIFQKQNLSKISTTAYISNKKSKSNFTFIQFGGANTHISLTGTKGIIDAIKNYDNLSETLGLYYIAQSHSKNSRGICLDFVKQFITKSSLKNNESTAEKISENIFNNMIDSPNLESVINNFSIENNSKKISIRYLVDSTGNIISVGYLQYNSKNLDTNNNLTLSHSFPKDGGKVIDYNSEITTLLKWSDYADSWNNFMFLYPTIFANSTDSITYSVMDNTTTIKSNELNFNTKKIQDKDNQLPVWRVVNQPPAGHKSQGLVIYIFMWHDENTIYQQLRSSSISRAFDIGPSFSINISKWTISNIINE